MECRAAGSGEGTRRQWTLVRRVVREVRLSSRLRQLWHQQWAALAAAAPAKLGSAAMRMCADGGTGGSVPWDGGAGACGGAGQTHGTEGALGRDSSKEGNVIENRGEVCLFIKLLGN